MTRVTVQTRRASWWGAASLGSGVLAIVGIPVSLFAATSGGEAYVAAVAVAALLGVVAVVTGAIGHSRLPADGGGGGVGRTLPSVTGIVLGTCGILAFPAQWLALVAGYALVVTVMVYGYAAGGF